MVLKKLLINGTKSSIKLLPHVSCFETNVVDNYDKFNENIGILLVLYVNDILLVNNDKDLLHEIKNFLI